MSASDLESEVDSSGANNVVATVEQLSSTSGSSSSSMTTRFDPRERFIFKSLHVEDGCVFDFCLKWSTIDDDRTLGDCVGDKCRTTNGRAFDLLVLDSSAACLVPDDSGEGISLERQ